MILIDSREKLIMKCNIWKTSKLSFFSLCDIILRGDKMKTICIQRKIEVIEGIKPKEGILVDTPELKQEILKEDGKLILRSHEIENTDNYNSVLDIDVFLNDDDILVKSGKGYTKPVAQFIEINEEEEKAIELLNRKLI